MPSDLDDLKCAVVALESWIDAFGEEHPDQVEGCKRVLKSMNEIIEKCESTPRIPRIELH